MPVLATSIVSKRAVTKKIFGLQRHKLRATVMRAVLMFLALGFALLAVRAVMLACSAGC